MVEIATKIGVVGFEVSGQGLRRVFLPGERKSSVVRGRIEPMNAAERQVAKSLRDYFAGKLKVFRLQLDLTGFSPFAFKVLNACAMIPYGSTMTYGELAQRAGSSKAARAVGRVMARNPIPIVIPCHRVIGRDGKLHGFRGGLKLKRSLLELEKGKSCRQG